MHLIQAGRWVLGPGLKTRSVLFSLSTSLRGRRGDALEKRRMLWAILTRLTASESGHNGWAHSSRLHGRRMRPEPKTGVRSSSENNIDLRGTWKLLFSTFCSKSSQTT